MIPDPKNPTPTSESIILEILSLKPRLSVKGLYGYFQKKYPRHMTIQGFYKHIKQLIVQRILVKEEHLISIDASWIHNLINFGETLKETYLKTSVSATNIILQEGEIKTFSFNSAMEMDNFWMHALITIIHYYESQSHKDKNVYNYNHHAWFQIAKTNQEQSLAEAYNQMGMQWYLVCGSSLFLDTLVSKFIDSKNLHYSQTANPEIVKPNYYFVVIGDFIFETSLTSYVYKTLEEIYNRVESISDFNSQEILRTISLPGKTSLTISKNKKRAEILRKKLKEIL